MSHWVALTALLAAFFIGMLIAPTFLRVSARYSVSQTILSYVGQHSVKQGVPTTGGLVFILATIISVLIFGGYKSSMTVVILIIFAGYGTIGFLDDLIKIRLKRNMGLRAYQKIISQVSVAILAAIYCAKSQYIGTVIMLPITGGGWDLGVWYIPFAAFVFLAMTNSVNLTDGLDGLAGTTNTIYFAAFSVIILFALADTVQKGDVLYQNELQGLAVFTTSLIGALMSFLWYNSYKAKFFMGDTGSLALGGAAAAVALFVKNPLISVLIGIMFVVSSVSVIIQVVSYKTRKKRVFLMSPF
ncbi:MAG: phospho-N-acetylmuramoyl-pentapeptide-transferase, partial [Clostridia bacterium]